MKRNDKRPFRFTALPPELQIAVSECLDFRTLKWLSLTSKATRGTAIKILLRSIRIPNKSNTKGIMLSKEAMSAVHSFTFTMLLDECNPEYPDTQGSYKAAIQSSMLPMLGNCQTITLDMCIAVNSSAQKPIVQLQSALAAIDALNSQAMLNIVLSFSRLSETTVDPNALITAVIRSLSGRSIRSLRLGELCRASDYLDVKGTLLPATEDFHHLVEHSTALEIEDLRWWTWLPRNSSPFHLQDLTVAVQLGDTPTTDLPRLLENLSVLLKECPSLSMLAMDIQDCYERPWYDPDIFPKLVSRKPLRQLTLKGDYVIPVDCLFPGVKCQSLVWEMGMWSSSWQDLTSTVLYHPQRLSYLKQLRIVFSGGYELSRFDWQSNYRNVRHALRERDVDFILERGYLGADVPPKKLLQCLSIIASELQTLVYHFEDGPIDVLKDYRNSTVLDLPLCKLLEISIHEFRYSEQLVSGSSAFAAIMRILTGSNVETLIIRCRSPFSNYLPTLTDCLRRNAFPALNSIEGCFEGENRYSSPLDRKDDNEQDGDPVRWTSLPEVLRRDAFESACEDRGVYIGNLAFR